MQFNDHLIDLPSLHQVIDHDPLTISPSGYVIEAINLMNQEENHVYNLNNVSRSLLSSKQQKKVTTYVLIVQQRQLLGIFTLADVLRLTALNIDLAKTTMAEVMTQQVMTLKLSDLDHISTVLYFLQQYGVPHLPIVDDEGNLVGIINESSLLHELDLVKVVGVVEAVNQTLINITNQSPENYQQREKVSGNTDNLLKTWIEGKIVKEIQINKELQQILEELQIIEEELRQQNEQLATAREITELERRRYQDLFEFTPDGFLVTDKFGVIQEANHAASSLLCVHQKYLVGKPITIFIGQLDRQNILSHLSSSQHFQEWEIYIQPREGQPFPASVRVRAVYDRQGQWRGWCWLICNISIQKQAEEVLRQSSDELEQRVAERTRELIVANQALEQEIKERQETQAALQKSEETFRQFGENLEAFIWICSQDCSTLFYINPAYEKIWGRSCQSLWENPLSWIEAVHPEDLERMMAEVEEQHQKGGNISVEYRIIRSDGSIRWLWSRRFPIKNEQGQIEYYGGIGEDITERKQAEAAVRQSEYKFRQFADNFLSVVWIAAANCTEDLYVNPAYEKVWGRSRASMGNNPKSWLEGVHPQDRDRVIAQMQSQKDNESGVLEYRVLRPDGSIRWVWARRFTIKNEQGEIEYFGGIAEDITERKQTEAQLKKTENKFRHFTENSDTLIWMASKDGKETLYINPAYEKIWGRSCQSLRENPQSWTQAIHPEDRDRILAEIAERHQKGEGANLEYRIIQPNGTVRWIWGRCFPIKNEKGELDYYGSLTEDITERKLAEESLRDSETRLTLALETANMGIWDWNMITNHCLWSDHVSPLYGLPKGSLCPPDYDDFYQFIHPEDRDIFQQNLNQSISQGSDFAVEYRAVWPDRSLHWLRGTGKVYHNQEGQPIRMIGTTRDISERKETEHQLYEQAALLDIATDAIFVRDFQTEILFWNQGAERMYGWQKHEALGKNLKDLFGSKTAQQQEATALRTVVKSGTWQGELRKKTKFGTEIIVESRWTLMFDADNQPKSILVVDSDITEKKQLEEQFFRTQRLESIGTLAGGISHDLNNILTPILGAAQLLKGRFAKNEEHHPQLLEIIENNAQRGAALVKQVLSFARGLKGEKGIVQIKHLIAEIIQIGKQTFPKSIEFTTQIPEDLWTVSGDTTQLHQVLMNLVVNARDAMPEGGTLTIITENIYIDEAYTRMLIESKIGNYIVITVTDTGVGMTKEVLDRIFEPFFTTKEFKGGTGLGLSTAVGIIKSHNGFMTVNSQVDKGSTFKVFLPSVESPQVPDIDLSKIPLGQGELILVVDDEPEIRDVATIILENHNYQTLTASNGVEAIALYAQYKKNISAILMDMMMPEMDGITAIRTLKKMNPKVQVIACSGLNTKDVFPESDELEVQSVLFKPYTANELLRSLNQIIHNS